MSKLEKGMAVRLSSRASETVFTVSDLREDGSEATLLYFEEYGDNCGFHYFTLPTDLLVEVCAVKERKTDSWDEPIWVRRDELAAYLKPKPKKKIIYEDS